MPYIDRYKLINELSTMYKSPTSAEDFMTVGYDHAISDVVVTVHEHPTADVVEVVRCKECKHRDAESGFCEGRGWPMQLVPDDGFCDKGERSEDADTGESLHSGRPLPQL